MRKVGEKQLIKLYRYVVFSPGTNIGTQKMAYILPQDRTWSKPFHFRLMFWTWTKLNKNR